MLKDRALLLHDEFIDYFLKNSWIQFNNGGCGYVADAISHSLNKINIPHKIMLSCFEEDLIIQKHIEEWELHKNLDKSFQDFLIQHIYVKLENGTLLDCYNQIDISMTQELIFDYGYIY